MTKFTEFFSDAAGAITIDWIAISAVIVLLAIMTFYAIVNGGMSELVPGYDATLAGEPAQVVVGTIVIE
ncbi:MAG: hypothetical protein IID49_02010 [Proteobacteria bacterium]|nr:hypothetical protein [Pseudomonadota bacterium]MCH8950886.1 hypothetical protein [Pseudomonadota bacterium]